MENLKILQINKTNTYFILSKIREISLLKS